MSWGEGRLPWAAYQQLITAYLDPDRKAGKAAPATVIASLGTSNGPTEAINGRLEHLRGSALGFRNLEHYIARSHLETGGFRPALQP